MELTENLRVEINDVYVRRDTSPEMIEEMIAVGLIVDMTENDNDTPDRRYQVTDHARNIIWNRS